MSQQKHRDPQDDFGYYAKIPRIVRAGYKMLTVPQKWLYVCLKDMCGDAGICFRTLPTLAKETGLSPATLSRSIPALQKEGLIDAEKKHRSAGGKEVWHIKIVDIWGLNSSEHPICKTEERFTEKYSSQKNVSQRNENVSQRNDLGGERFTEKQERFTEKSEELTRKTNKIEEQTERRNAAPVAASRADDALSPVSPPSATSSSEETPPTEKALTSQEVVRLLDAWDHLIGRKDTRPPWVVSAATELIRINATIEQIKLIRDDLLKKPPRKGINLETIVNEWKRLPALLQEQQERATPTANGTKPSITMNEATRKRLEALKAAQQKG